MKAIMTWLSSHWMQILNIVCAVLVGGAVRFAWWPFHLKVNQAMEIGAFLAVWGIHLPPITYGSKFAMIQKAKAAVKQISTSVLLVLFSALGLTAFLATSTLSETGCGPHTQEIEAIVPNGVTCAEDIAGDITGNVNIAGTLQSCGMTIEQLIDLIKNWQAAPDAGPDGALAAQDPARAAHLQKLLEAAEAYKASHPNDKAAR